MIEPITGSPISMPIVEFRMVYGMADDGTPATSTSWITADGGDDVSHIIRLGMLEAAKEELTIDQVMFMGEDDGDDA